MLSASSSSSVSAATMSCSTWARVSWSTLRISRTLSSLSKTLIAYQRCCSSGMSWTMASSIWAIACSTGPEKVCWGTVLSTAAAWTAISAASVTPVPFRAEISATLQPSFSESFSKSIWSPFFLTRSHMLTATTTGMPSSTSCVVR